MRSDVCVCTCTYDPYTSVRPDPYTSTAEVVEKAREGYGRVPRVIPADPRLTDKDARIFSAMSGLERKGVVRSGMRSIAIASNSHVETVCRCVAKLERLGYLRREKRDRGKRQEYTLLSPVFTNKPKKSFGGGVQPSKLSRSVRLAAMVAQQKRSREDIEREYGTATA